MTTSDFCQYTFIIFNTTGYSLQYLDCQVLISPDFVVIYFFLDKFSCLVAARLCAVCVTSLYLYRNVPKSFNYIILLLLIIFWYAISSFMCSHLLSKNYSLHLCVSLNFSNVWSTSPSLLSWGLLISSTYLLLLRSSHIFNQKLANPCHLFQCFIITDFNEKGLGRRESVRENERKEFGMRGR